MLSERTYRVNGKRIKELRQSRKLTQAQLAAAIGCSVDTIKRLEKGHAALRGTVEALANVLGVPLSDLLEEFRNVRDVSGDWTVLGQDLVVPGLFECAVPPKNFQAAITIVQNERQLFGSGRDRDDDLNNCTHLGC